MTFLADQYAGPKGCWVEFFGRPASAHKAIALLALDNNAKMSVCSSLRLDRPMHLRVVGVRQVVPAVAERRDALVREHPHGRIPFQPRRCARATRKR